VTVKLGTYTFVSEPEIVFDLDAELAEKPKYGGGTTLTHVGNGPLRITLTGKLTGANRYADRDTLIGLLKSGSKQGCGEVQRLHDGSPPGEVEKAGRRSRAEVDHSPRGPRPPAG